MDTTVSEEHAASIFKVEEFHMMEVAFLQNSGNLPGYISLHPRRQQSS
jgi:hypothetical protein